jgi:hypothetical protein
LQLEDIIIDSNILIDQPEFLTDLIKLSSSTLKRLTLKFYNPDKFEAPHNFINSFTPVLNTL